MRRPAIRQRVNSIPLLAMKDDGHVGVRMDLRIVKNEKGLYAVLGLDSEGRQVTSSREPCENLSAVNHYLAEAQMKLERAIIL